MTPGSWWRVLGRSVFPFALTCAATALLSGCSVVQTLESDPGTDISSVKAGATREQVEALVGQPQREWVTRTGIRYCLYRYDAGYEANPAAAGLMVFMDAISLGIWEIVTVAPQPADFRGPRKYPLIAVSYDPDGVALGVFRDVGEFTAFPEDGQPTGARSYGAGKPDPVPMNQNR